jgi:hypothetical protein
VTEGGSGGPSGPFQRSLRTYEEEAQRSALELLEVHAGELGRDHLGGVSILDVGCGVKSAQAIHHP